MSEETQSRERKPNLLERFLFGPNANKGLIALDKKEGLQFDFNPLGISSTWGPQGYSAYGTYGSTIDYTVAAGDLIDNSAVCACLNWLMRNFPKSTPRVVLPSDDGLKPVPNHQLTALLKRPNKHYAGTQLWQGTVLSYNWNGNAYWRKVRNSSNQVIELWYEPHWTIRPVRANANDFISYYQIWRGREWIQIETTEIVHFRWGIDPRNTMLGLAPLASALREVFTDNEAARYAAVMFKNLGVPGAIISPADGEVPFTPSEGNRLKAEWEAMTTGDQRGNAVVTVYPTNISMPTTDPTKMNTTENRRISEERISALLLLPAAIAGLGAGLAHSSENNRDDDARRAFDDNIIPSQDSMSEEMDIQLLPDFSSIDAETIEFDQSRVRVLRGDQERKDTVSALLWNSDALTRSQMAIRTNYKPPIDASADQTKSQFLGKTGPQAAPDTAPADGLGTGADSIASGGKALLLGSGKKAKGDRPKEFQAIVDGLTDDLKEEVEGMFDEAVSVIKG